MYAEGPGDSIKATTNYQRGRRKLFPLAVILSPTRELASQVRHPLLSFSDSFQFLIASLVDLRWSAQVRLSLACTSLCCLWWCWCRCSNARFRSRLSSSCRYTRSISWLLKTRQDWFQLHQVSYHANVSLIIYHFNCLDSLFLMKLIECWIWVSNLKFAISSKKAICQ